MVAADELIVTPPDYKVLLQLALLIALDRLSLVSLGSQVHLIVSHLCRWGSREHLSLVLGTIQTRY